MSSHHLDFAVNYYNTNPRRNIVNLFLKNSDKYHGWTSNRIESEIKEILFSKIQYTPVNMYSSCHVFFVALNCHGECMSVYTRISSDEQEYSGLEFWISYFPFKTDVDFMVSIAERSSYIGRYLRDRLEKYLEMVGMTIFDQGLHPLPVDMSRVKNYLVNLNRKILVDHSSLDLPSVLLDICIDYL